MSKLFKSLVVVSLLTMVIALTGCGTPAAETPATETPAATEQPAAEAPAAEAPAPTAEDVTELQVEDLVEGTGAEAKSGDNVTVHYTGWLTDGTKFDSSVDSGQPFQFPLGAGRVIPGWDQGVEGMKVGGKRKLTIPPSLGYGEQGAGGVIPPNATLVFEVELISVD